MKNAFKDWLNSNKMWMWLFIGAVVASFIHIVIPSFAEWVIAPISIWAFIQFAINHQNEKYSRAWNGIALFLGALLIQIMIWIEPTHYSFDDVTPIVDEAATEVVDSLEVEPVDIISIEDSL